MTKLLTLAAAVAGGRGAIVLLLPILWYIYIPWSLLGEQYQHYFPNLRLTGKRLVILIDRFHILQNALRSFIVRKDPFKYLIRFILIRAASCIPGTAPTVNSLI